MRNVVSELCRPPTGAEKDTMREFLATEAVRLIEESVKSPAVLDAQTARQKAVDQLCRVIFNLNEFVYPD